MILRSKTLGPVRVSDGSIVYLPDGILGFEDLKRFAVAELKETQPFVWMISTEDPNVCFSLVDPDLIFPGGYEANLSDADKDILDLQADDQVSLFVLVSAGEGGRRTTANLKGPVVVNLRNRVAKQIVVYNPAYSYRHPVLPQSERVRPEAARVSRHRLSA